MGWLFNRCKHDDELIDKHVMPSLVDRAWAQTQQLHIDGFLRDMQATKVIFTFKCAKCKRVRTRTETNP